jgi:taurine dioxygenase
MKCTVHAPIGAEITDISLADLDPPTVVQLRALLAEHGVLILPDQPLDDAEFLAFLKSFGELTFTKGETSVEGYPDLNVVSNVGRSTPARSTFHVDTSYVARPPAYTALRAVTIPASGGETLFSNQYRAYDTLRVDVKAKLAGRMITHVVTGVSLEDGDEHSAEHPVFRRHPLSGRTALYMSTPSRCAAISGLSAEESEQTVRFLFEHSTREDNVRRHPWAPDDVVIWDNGCVLHRADHSQVDGDRVMHRGMVAGYDLSLPPAG